MRLPWWFVVGVVAGHAGYLYAHFTINPQLSLWKTSAITIFVGIVIGGLLVVAEGLADHVQPK